MLAGTHSGVGKTTVATGIMAALARRGHSVASAKVGPDFIDPGYHALATRRPAQNLDSWMCGPQAMVPMAARCASGSSLLVVEGVMGLFDGAGPSRRQLAPPARGLLGEGGSPGPEEGADGGLEAASTAELAHLLRAPVILVVDASAMSSSVAAVVHGFASFSPHVRVAGVVLNKVGSEGHEASLRLALDETGIPVVGALRRDSRIQWRDRHLGLVPVVEDPAGSARALDRMAAEVERRCDLEALVRIAESAPWLGAAPLEPAERTGRVRVAVAGGPAFSFAYPDNLRRLEEAGAELVPFDPLNDDRLPPAIGGLYAGGGFPEVHAEKLSSNTGMLADVRDRTSRGLVTWAECGGLLWLCRSLDGAALCGLIGTDARMTARLELGYREARALRPSPVLEPGATVRGHEFHYSRLADPGGALELTGRQGTSRGGFATSSMLASYLHLHMGADPSPAERFVLAATRAAERTLKG